MSTTMPTAWPAGTSRTSRCRRAGSKAGSKSGAWGRCSRSRCAGRWYAEEPINVPDLCQARHVAGGARHQSLAFKYEVLLPPERAHALTPKRAHGLDDRGPVRGHRQRQVRAGAEHHAGHLDIVTELAMD